MITWALLSTVVLASWEDELTAGSMGGYFTPAELGTYLTSLQSNFTDLITLGQSSSRSVYELPINYALLTANTGLALEERTAVMITAGQSAEQPLVVTQALYLLAKWANEFSSTSRVKVWLQTLKVYFVPMANPDAYLELSSRSSRTSVPSGRVKNLKNTKCGTATGQTGVNLDRNYPFKFKYDDLGSSYDVCSDTYRGNAALSEPETQAMDKLRSLFDPELWIHIDGTGNYRVMPLTYSTSANLTTAHLGVYKDISASLGGLKTHSAAFNATANGSLLDYAYATGAISLYFSSSAGIPTGDAILSKVKEDAAHYETVLDYGTPYWK
jgi:hypothetical protein